MTAVVAMVVPKFGLFINLVGSFACTALGFVIPVLVYNKAHEKELTNLWLWLHRLLIIFGVIGGSMSFYVSIVNIVIAF
jgi:amino acid permease